MLRSARVPGMNHWVGVEPGALDAITVPCHLVGGRCPPLPRPASPVLQSAILWSPSCGRRRCGGHCPVCVTLGEEIYARLEGVKAVAALAKSSIAVASISVPIRSSTSHVNTCRRCLRVGVYAKVTYEQLRARPRQLAEFESDHHTPAAARR